MKQFAGLLFVLLSVGQGFSQGTGFTYQGRLNDGTNLAAGIYDLQFCIYDSAANGDLLAGPVTNASTLVTNGLFTVLINFGNSLPTGASNWLDISVRTNGASSFVELTPRQQMTPSPYAVVAQSVASGGIGSGNYNSAVSFNNLSDQFSGTFQGSGAGLTNVPGEFVTPEMFGALGGTNDDTAAFTTMLATGKPIITYGSNYTASSLVIPNNTYWIGRGTIIYQLATATSYLINAGASTNFHLDGIIVDGQNYTTPPLRVQGTRGGFLLNQLGDNSEIENCEARGFDGYGFRVTGFDVGSGGHNLPLVAMTDCRAMLNYVGFSFESTTGLRGEYICLKGLQGFTNTFGVEPDAGNVLFAACRFCDNVTALRINPGVPNQAHGSFVGCSFNHSTVSAISITGDPVGELFDGCCFLGGNNNISITNSAGVIFDGCYFDIYTTFTSTGGTAGFNVIENSLYAGVWADQFVKNLDGRLLFFNNNARDQLGDASPNTLMSLGTYSTNYSNVISPLGYTNYTGRNQILNVQGSYGAYVFYMRSGNAGTNVASIPLWTNGITSTGTPVYLGANCGVQVLSGSGIQLQVSDQ